MKTYQKKPTNSERSSINETRKKKTDADHLKDSLSAEKKIQNKRSDNGLPHQLKSGIEQLSGMSMDDVKVHYNSSKPFQLGAHAYAQGGDIYIAPGQQQHLSHEAWHVVQQKQGRVKQTKVLNGNYAVNDERHLEHEADRMGNIAAGLTTNGTVNQLKSVSVQSNTVQGFWSSDEKNRRNTEVNSGFIEALYNKYYNADGTRKSVPLKKEIYKMMGVAESPDYATHKINTAAFDGFTADKTNKRVSRQKKATADNAASLAGGDYFHVHNRHYIKTADKTNKARRLIVNINAQNAVFQLAQRLVAELFTPDHAVGKYIREFKIYLTNKDPKPTRSKKDKVVIYYELPNVGDSDTIGADITSLITANVDAAHLVDDFGPFYSHLAHGVAWAEEPKYHSPLTSSFTETRAQLLDALVKENDTVASLADFTALVHAKFTANKVDPARPHTHLP